MQEHQWEKVSNYEQKIGPLSELQMPKYKFSELGLTLNVGFSVLGEGVLSIYGCSAGQILGLRQTVMSDCQKQEEQELGPSLGSRIVRVSEKDCQQQEEQELVPSSVLLLQLEKAEFVAEELPENKNN